MMKATAGLIQNNKATVHKSVDDGICEYFRNETLDILDRISDANRLKRIYNFAYYHLKALENQEN